MHPPELHGNHRLVTGICAGCVPKVEGAGGLIHVTRVVLVIDSCAQSFTEARAYPGPVGREWPGDVAPAASPGSLIAST
jgi:hypothetical protein